MVVSHEMFLKKKRKEEGRTKGGKILWLHLLGDPQCLSQTHHPVGIVTPLKRSTIKKPIELC